MDIPTFVFIFILFRTNILLLLLYPKHVIKPLGYNLGCYRSSPCRSISLLGIAHPVIGKYFQVLEVPSEVDTSEV